MFKSYKVQPQVLVPVLIFQILLLTFLVQFSNGHFIDHFDIINKDLEKDGCDDEDDEDCTEGMSNGLKLGLIIGGSVLGVLLLIGLGTFIYFRLQKKKLNDQIQNQKPGRKRFIHQLSRPSIYSIQDDPGVSNLPEPIRSGPMVTRASINLGVENHGFHDSNSFDENDGNISSDEKTITNVNSPATPMSITDDGNITSSSSFNYNPEPNSNYNSFINENGNLQQNGRFHINRTDISDYFSPHDDINNRRPQPPPYEILYPTNSSTDRRASGSSRSSFDTDDGISIRLQNFNGNQHVFIPGHQSGISRQKRYSITPPIPVTEL